MPVFAPWHDFYILIGTASATLIGLLFVAVSVGNGVFTHERQVGLRTLLSPAVVAFGVVLAASLLAVMPLAARWPPVCLLTAMGILGLVYSWIVWRRMAKGGITKVIDLEDHGWYLVAPALAYALVGTAGLTLATEPANGLAMLAAGVCLLLLAGLRNAWDMTTSVVLRRRE